MIEEKLMKFCGKSLKDASDEEIFDALIKLVQEKSGQSSAPIKGKKLYYISAEFLIGKLLSNHLINLGIYDEVKECLENSGKSITDLEEFEPEPSLGNGGLGRLAACFLDSLATLNLPGDGIGLRYHCGLFHQDFKNLIQNERPDYWLRDNSWAVKTDTVYPVILGNNEYTARLYQMDIIGYGGHTNKLNLFDLDSVDERKIEEGISFDKNDIEKNLTLFLYPDDSDEAGCLLRLYQQYFMVSAGAQMILDECEKRGSDFYDLADYAAVQINDTHPSMIIPELIRLLGEKGIDFEDAAEIVTKVCAYTNHTILAEALEKWPLSYLQKVVPHLLPIIRKLDKLAKARTADKSVSVIDEQNVVHMAHMDIHFSHSINGVAEIHTEILKNSELHNFYQLYPEKFNNKTNGITFRRWLLLCNPRLAGFIEELIGPGFKRDASELRKLKAYIKDGNVLKRLMEIKTENKKDMAAWLKEKQGCRIDTESVFAIQSKRLHEYKRQQLNLLYLIHQYFEIKSGHIPAVPVTAVFGAKAAPAYTIAKDIIHALLTLSHIISADTQVSRWLNIVFVENYNVTAAERIIPACDLSEQISLASKEASGTGNMKFMLNGAVTLGTLDGANVEIANCVGNDNIYIFGQSSHQVMERYANGSYHAEEWYAADPNIRRAVDFLVSKEMLSKGHEENLRRLQSELINKDWFQTFPDFNAYLVRKNQALCDYSSDKEKWRKMVLINISEAGVFSADRTVEEYNRDIWHLKDL